MMQHWSDHLDLLRGGAKVLKGKFGGTFEVMAGRQPMP